MGNNMIKYFLSLFLFLQMTSLVFSQWVQTNGPAITVINKIYKYQGILFAGTKTNGVYKSTDNGNTWMPANSGIESTNAVSITSQNNFLFAAVSSNSDSLLGVYRSSDEGQTWVQVNNGLGILPLVNTLFADDSALYAGEFRGIRKSTNNGELWYLPDSALENETIYEIVESNNVLFTELGGLLISSNDGGNSWAIDSIAYYYYLHALTVYSNFIYAANSYGGGMIISSDYGQTWGSYIPINLLQGSGISSFVKYNGLLFAGTGIGVIKSTDNGQTWQAANFGIEEAPISSLLYSSPKLFAECSSGGIFASTDDGNSWATSNTGLPGGGTVRGFMADSLYLFAGLQSDGIYRTSDHGMTWQSADSDATGDLNYAQVTSFEKKDNTIYAATSAGIYKSTNEGSFWEKIANGLPSGTGVFTVAAAGGNLIIGTYNGIYYSTDNGNDWIISNINSGFVNTMAVGNGFQYSSTYNGFYRSSDNGETWTTLSEAGAVALAASGDNVYFGLGPWANGIYHSTDDGTTWSSALSDIGVFSICVSGQYVFAGTDGSVYMSDLSAVNWQSTGDGLPPDAAVNAIGSDGVNLYAGPENYGAAWMVPLDEIILPVELQSFTAAVNNGNVILEWTTATETNNKGFEVERNTNESQYQEIAFITGHGTTTQLQKYSYTDNNVENGNYTYRLKQVNFDGTFKYSKEVEVNVKVPLQFALGQNYPNPFNPTTQISYTIAKDGFVNLTVFNTLGQQVATLVNENIKAGNYHITFDASRFASGVYYYRLQSDNNVMVKKMVLMK
jgi:photosystem II stability/assembly factor-like uncharacterized protein